ncbi:MAG: type I restriction enzyme HsdR N-terminal domain-containing protein [Bacteroidales bacterium]|nr:type I restriction enzyme HsdR N-terminal domain-containing protein [Bacteroidales bacterium]
MPQEIKTRENKDRTEVFDIVRQRWVALTPEEWVRQNLIHHLHHALGYPLELMQVEGAITLNGLTKRCDIVIYDKATHPVMIIETKQSEVPINQKVVDQACRYNLVLQVPYLLLSNGRQTLCLLVSPQSPYLRQLPYIPKWDEMSTSFPASKETAPRPHTVNTK